jgi:hypothetical protein
VLKTRWILKKIVASQIIVTPLFKDLSTISINSDWFTSKYDLQFTYDLASSIILFFLIYLFYIQSKKTFPEPKLIPSEQATIGRFISVKKLIATFLVPIFILLAIYSLTTWLVNSFSPGTAGVDSFNNINNIFINAPFL